MPGSILVARVAGIPIHAHATFVLVLIYGAVQWGRGGGVAGMAFGVLATLVIFVGVALHELGHAVVARRVGIPVLGIVLLPIGGVAALGRNPERPRQELVIALAGPLVNVALAIPLALALALVGMQPALQTASYGLPGWRSLLAIAFMANLALAAFNLLPIFPLDGGKVLRALLALRLGRRRATRISAGLGQGSAILLGAWAFATGQAMLSLIAVFLFFAAAQERRMVLRGDATGR